jgi:hypothetical protein
MSVPADRNTTGEPRAEAQGEQLAVAHGCMNSAAGRKISGRSGSLPNVLIAGSLPEVRQMTTKILVGGQPATPRKRGADMGRRQSSCNAKLCDRAEGASEP